MKDKLNQILDHIDREYLLNFSNFNRENFHPETASYWGILIVYILFSFTMFIGSYPLISFLIVVVCIIFSFITEAKYNKKKSFTDFQLYGGTYMHTMGIMALLGAFKSTYHQHAPGVWVLGMWLIGYGIVSILILFFTIFLIKRGTFSGKNKAAKNLLAFSSVGVISGMMLSRIFLRRLSDDQAYIVMITLLLLLSICGALGSMLYLKYYVIKRYRFDEISPEKEDSV